jgi:SAM-dependent methyltransferase
MRESTGGRLALRQWRRKLVRSMTSRVLDASAGMETTRPTRNPDAGELLSPYQPACWTVLRAAFRADPVRPDDVFCDFGCGKGRVLHLASWYPFRSIHGMDLDRGMVNAANLTNARGPARLRAIEVVHGDARSVRLPHGMPVEQEWLLGTGFVHVRETAVCTGYAWGPGERR